MNLYDNDTDSREILRSFMGLALLPIDRILIRSISNFEITCSSAILLT